jgi:glycerol kinase
MSGPYIVAVDLGSGSTRSVVVDKAGRICGESRQSVQWTYPFAGWANVDPNVLVRSVEDTLRTVLAESAIDPPTVVALGITSHRESIIMWDRSTGAPVHDGIIWISSQTDDIVSQWSRQGLDERIEQSTGLRNDSFFSAGKIAWILENVAGVRARAERGELAVGTVDCWILWNLTGGTVHATDPSCASRTALYDIAAMCWDTELCAMLGIPTSLLPEVRESNAEFGVVRADLLGHQPPIRAVIADQQAGMLGQGCLASGSAKHTFGTAGVLTANTGSTPSSIPGMTASVGWSISGQTDYEVEGVVFSSGQTLQWLRETAGLFQNDDNVETLITSVDSSDGVVIVPAFGGMCSPHWRRDIRASISGLSLTTNRAHLARAAVEASVFQATDILFAFQKVGLATSELKVDGGGAQSDFVCQLFADLGRVNVVRPRQLERTALGCAFAAGIAVGIWRDTLDATSTWEVDLVFTPEMGEKQRDVLLDQWHTALTRVLQ